ncbi:MAG: peptidoglycan-binding protein, partial [Azoarcus sp.]|nr:peptidoglycan-binding protein [Azoarcus sp.]
MDCFATLAMTGISVGPLGKRPKHHPATFISHPHANTRIVSYNCAFLRFLTQFLRLQRCFMLTNLTGSVGAFGKNLREDVGIVQTLLKAKKFYDSAIDRVCGRKTLRAILWYQKQLRFSKPDGRIDPKGKNSNAEKTYLT